MGSNGIEIDQEWTLFLDRDGVINIRLMDDYVRTVMQFQFLEGVQESMCQLYEMFDKVFVVTNQQGIGKGLMSEQDLTDIHRYMKQGLQCGERNIDAVYHAPALTSVGSELRKPNIGMALLAKRQFPSIDLTKSIMVGDSMSDMEFGKNAGMVTVFVHPTPYIHPHIDLCISSLKELPSRLIYSQSSSSS